MGGAGAGAAQLGRVPAELLHAILAHAALPLSAWRPEMPAGRVLQNVWQFENLPSPQRDLEYW